MDIKIHIFGYLQQIKKINYWVDDGGTLQDDMTLPYYPDLPIEKDNIIRTYFDNLNMINFAITDV